MTNSEFILRILTESMTSKISRQNKPKGFQPNRKVARQGGTVAGNACKEIEEKSSPGKTQSNLNEHIASMSAQPLDIPNVILFTPKAVGDDCGGFCESFNQNILAQHAGLQHQFVQDTHSKSHQRPLRGLLYQLPPKAEGKQVRAVQGGISEVILDVHKSSPSFCKWVGAQLLTDNKQQLWIQKGFAHVFVTLSETAEFLYKTTSFYSPKHEQCIAWNDQAIGIHWKLLQVLLSGKYLQGKALADAEVFA